MNGPAAVADIHDDINVVAVTAYQARIDQGRPFAERKLAAMFVSTSRRGAHSRMIGSRGIAT